MKEFKLSKIISGWYGNSNSYHINNNENENENDIVYYVNVRKHGFFKHYGKINKRLYLKGYLNNSLEYSHWIRNFKFFYYL